MQSWGSKTFTEPDLVRWLLTARTVLTDDEIRLVLSWLAIGSGFIIDWGVR